MKTISENVSHEIILKNSRFISLLYRVHAKDEISSLLKDVHEQFPKATHYCYGYILGEEKKSSDDGEPSGTAGFPILNVLEKEELSNILAVVVRYFGGIKLGAGGLVRAYTKSVTEALKMCSFVELVKGYKVSLTFPYSQEKQIRYLLGNSIVLETSYQESISYVVLIEENLLSNFYSYSYEILEELLLEKTS